MKRALTVLLLLAAATVAVAGRLDLIQLRSGTSAEWASADPVLANGEPGFDETTGGIKVGDGATAWSALGWPFLRDADITSGTLTPATGNVDLSGGTDGQALLFDGSGNIAPGDVTAGGSAVLDNLASAGLQTNVTIPAQTDIFIPMKDTSAPFADPQGLFDSNGRYVVPVDGKYQAIVFFVWKYSGLTISDNIGAVYTRIAKNDVPQGSGTVVAATSSFAVNGVALYPSTFVISPLLDLSTGDTIEAQARCNSATNIDAEVIVENSTYLAVWRVSE